MAEIKTVCCGEVICRTLLRRSGTATAVKKAYQERLSLAYANLSGVSLLWLHLQGMDFRNADLSDADLRWAHLEGVDFRGAKMEGADLRGAHVDGARIDYETFIQVDTSNVVGTFAYYYTGLEV